MVTPTVHLNGTSRDALLVQYADAGHALALAVEKLNDAAPNARDYYPQGPHSFALAVAQHHARIARVRGVMDEVAALCEAVATAP